MARFLGIDLGTSFLKGAVLDLHNRSLDQVRRIPTPDPLANCPAGRCELDPEEILSAVRRLLADLLATAPDATGLVVSSQMHCLVFTDSVGTPKGNVVTWKDQRGQDRLDDGSTSFERLRQRLGADRLLELGGEVRIGVPVTTLHRMREQGELASASGLFAASLPDFVLANLCGIEPTSEPTLASAHGLLHHGTLQWHHEVIRELCFESLRFPRIRTPGERIGVAFIAGRPLTCFTPIGDMQAALLGVGLRSGELSINVSTGSQVSLLASQRRPGNYQTRPYFDGQWLHTIVQLPAGRALDLLVRLLTEIGEASGLALADPWGYIERAVEAVPTTDLLVNPAFYAGAMGDRGSISNLREENATVGNLFAATFRRLAENYAACADRLAPERDWNRVVFSGGLVQRFDRLRRDILDRLETNTEARLCESSEDALMGLLTLARYCTGMTGRITE